MLIVSGHIYTLAHCKHLRLMCMYITCIYMTIEIVSKSNSYTCTFTFVLISFSIYTLWCSIWLIMVVTWCVLTSSHLERGPLKNEWAVASTSLLCLSFSSSSFCFSFSNLSFSFSWSKSRPALVSSFRLLFVSPYTVTIITVQGSPACLAPPWLFPYIVNVHNICTCTCMPRTLKVVGSSPTRSHPRRQFFLERLLPWDLSLSCLSQSVWIFIMYKGYRQSLSQPRVSHDDLEIQDVLPTEILAGQDM